MKRLQMLLLAIISTCILILSGCAFSDIDAANVGPPDKYWSKLGVSASQQTADAMGCVHGKERPLIDVINDQDKCMLEKGYTLIPRPAGYKNICTLNSFRNSFACRVRRGEITVQSDEAASPSSVEDSQNQATSRADDNAPPSFPNYDRINPPSSVLQDSVTRRSNDSANRLLNNIKR